MDAPQLLRLVIAEALHQFGGTNEVGEEDGDGAGALFGGHGTAIIARECSLTRVSVVTCGW